MKEHEKIFLNINFCENWAVSSAVMAPGQFEISIKQPKIDILSDLPDHNSVNFKDRDLKVVLNERVSKILSY